MREESARKNRMKPWVAAGLAVAGLFVAVSLEGQVPGGRRAPANPVVQMTPAERLDMQINMMATALTLNEAQKRQFRRTLDEARAASVPIQDAISQGRSALIDAIKTGKG